MTVAGLIAGRVRLPRFQDCPAEGHAKRTIVDLYYTRLSACHAGDILNNLLFLLLLFKYRAPVDAVTKSVILTLSCWNSKPPALILLQYIVNNNNFVIGTPFAAVCPTKRIFCGGKVRYNRFMLVTHKRNFGLF